MAGESRAAAVSKLQVVASSIGHIVNVPNYPEAKLAYYLDCICSVINVDTEGLLWRLRGYDAYHYDASFLWPDEIKQLLELCQTLEPGVLNNKVIFQLDSMCGSYGNKFYKINAVSSTLAVSDSVMVGGERRVTTQIMCYKMEWLHEYYTEPLRQVITKRQQYEQNRQEDNCVIL